MPLGRRATVWHVRNLKLAGTACSCAPFRTATAPVCLWLLDAPASIWPANQLHTHTPTHPPAGVALGKCIEVGFTFADQVAAQLRKTKAAA